MELQPASQDILQAKYLQPGETCVEDVFKRVAKGLAALEKDDNEKWEQKFYDAMMNGAIPAGRILANVGVMDKKTAVSTINCVVSGTIEDSMKGILDRLHDAGMVLKTGSGIGYDFTTVRPKGAYIAGAGANTTGPIPFMQIFDSMCQTVSSYGWRRGAQMGAMEVCHPDILDFIKAKRQTGMLRQFNLSILVTDAFMEALKNDAGWDLYFPSGSMDTGEKIAKPWPMVGDYIRDGDGLVLCTVYRTVKAKEVWKAIMDSNYEFAEPGVLFIDRINDMNPLNFKEVIRTTNPCGEQPLPPNGACLLGSINLTKFVKRPFTGAANFDAIDMFDTVKIFTRMLDNVVEINGLSLPAQDREIREKRRHGMGFFGLGSALAMLRVKYGSSQAIAITENISRAIFNAGWYIGVELAKEKGPAPILKDADNRLLFSQAKLFQTEMSSILVKNMVKYGCRFTHHMSIAPTGTIALSIGNNCSSGIEPTFAHSYTRNIIVPGKKTKQSVNVESYEFMLYKKLVDPNATVDNLPKFFRTANDITTERHLLMQAAAQRYVDSSISKTINVPTDIKMEDFEGIYLRAHQLGLKGCTTFRFNHDAFQGVLVTKESTDGLLYNFHLKDGTIITARANDQIEYQGETHTAANLYDAIKEGNYGKF